MLYSLYHTNRTNDTYKLINFPRGIMMERTQLKGLNTKFQKLKSFGVFWVLIAIIILAAIIEPGFLKFNNLINVIRQIAINGIIAVGMTFVLLTGGIDLSVGASVGVVAVSVAMMFQKGINPVLAIVIGLLISAVIGFLNGLGITKGKIVPFIMTLGTLTAFRGLALYIANGSPQSWRKSGVDIKFIGQGDFLGIPIPVFIFFVVLIGAYFVLKYTSFGRSVYAIGDSREAARLSGINVVKTEWIVYTLSGFLAGLSSLILISRLSVGEPTAGEGAELDAIAMAVIGGTSTSGGIGGVGGTLIGAALLSVIANLLNIIGISPFIQRIVKGLIIILAVLLERKQRRAKS
jgi:ribose transport system permease protein